MKISRLIIGVALTASMTCLCAQSAPDQVGGENAADLA